MQANGNEGKAAAIEAGECAAVVSYLRDTRPALPQRPETQQPDDHVDPTRVVHRRITTRDLPFITNSWLESNRRRGYRHLERQIYFHWHHRVIEALIPSSKVIVACDADDPDKLYGYGVACSDAPALIVHYLYVRGGWRGLGIGTSIVRAWRERFNPTALVWTHSSDAFESFVKHLRKSGELDVPGIHNPYIGFKLWAEAETARAK